MLDFWLGFALGIVSLLAFAFALAPFIHTKTECLCGHEPCDHAPEDMTGNMKGSCFRTNCACVQYIARTPIAVKDSEVEQLRKLAGLK